MHGPCFNSRVWGVCIGICKCKNFCNQLSTFYFHFIFMLSSFEMVVKEEQSKEVFTFKCVKSFSDKIGGFLINLKAVFLALQRVWKSIKQNFALDGRVILYFHLLMHILSSLLLTFLAFYVICATNLTGCSHQQLLHKSLFQSQIVQWNLDLETLDLEYSLDLDNGVLVTKSGFMIYIYLDLVQS